MKNLLTIILTIICFQAFGQIKISNLPTESTITDSTIFICVKSSVTKKTYMVDLQDYLNFVNIWSKSGTDVYVTGVSVGIGTASPNYPLEVIGKFTCDSAVIDTLRFGNDNTIIIGDTVFVSNGDTLLFSEIAGTWYKSGNYILQKDTTDSVGIGTLIPNSIFDVNNNFNVFYNGNLDINGYFTIGDTTDVYSKFTNRNWSQYGTGYSTFIGESAGSNDDFTDNENIFIGKNSGFTNTTGYANVFVGATSGYSHESGYYNIFIGRNSGVSDVSSFENTFIGAYSGYNNTISQENIFLGAYSGNSNTTGQQNTFLGVNCGYSNTTQTGNVMVGYKAGENAKSATKLYIHNSNADSLNVLIYGDFATNWLRINNYLSIDTTKGEALFVNGEAKITDTAHVGNKIIWSETSAIEFDTVIIIPHNTFEVATTTPILLLDSSKVGWATFCYELQSVSAFLNWNSVAYPDSRSVELYYGKDSDDKIWFLLSIENFTIAVSDTIGIFNNNAEVYQPNGSIWLKLDADMSNNNGDSPIHIALHGIIRKYE